MDAIRNIDSLIVAKEWAISNSSPGLHVACFFHVDWGRRWWCLRRKKRTYFISREKWREYYGVGAS